MTDSLDRYLRSADGLSRLTEHAARLARLQAILARELPPLMADSCGVANLKGDELVLHARSGAVATRLKQMLPSLQQAYARQGVLLAAIKIKVEVKNPKPARPAVPHRAVSTSARDSLAQLATALPAGSALAEALRRLIGRSA